MQANYPWPKSHAVRDCTTMTRMVIDLPAKTPINRLTDLATDLDCAIVRRPDGSLLFRPRKENS